MTLSTARKITVLAHFVVPGAERLLATAERVVYAGSAKRYQFPDGSVLESVNGKYKVIEMKNPKLEAAIKRFGDGKKTLNTGVMFQGSPAQREAWFNSGTNKTFEEWIMRKCAINASMLEDGYLLETTALEDTKPTYVEGSRKADKIALLQYEVAALHKMLDEKDELLDAAQRPMVVRLDWWAIALVATFLTAHGLGYL